MGGGRGGSVCLWRGVMRGLVVAGVTLGVTLLTGSGEKAVKLCPGAGDGAGALGRFLFPLFFFL